MGELEFMTDEEKRQFADLSDKLRGLTEDFLSKEDFDAVTDMVATAGEHSQALKECFGLNEKIFDLQTAIITAEEIGMGRAAILSILLRGCVAAEMIDIDGVRSRFGDDVANIIHGLIKVNELYSKNPAIETENFRDLLLSFAEDMRVVLIIIADRVNLMRQIKDRGTDEERQRVAKEASQLYAPLAHKLGLYVVKSELEDLSLKYLEHDTYYMIKEKLSATKKARDLYITNFIAPVEKKLKEAGLKFHIKGRTKSIHSIWQKMKKQKCQFENIYDLFAIRVILDSELDKEKQDCWQAYSIVTDMYQPNPKRLRDWLSIPKSNGYESLHITVMGPEGKWVEIQIRSERMDEVAERGIAAHWRYKGVHGSGSRNDEWLARLREIMEESTNKSQIANKIDTESTSEEVFVFTPAGDLRKLPKGATVLDFAFDIHTHVGAACTGAKIGGRNVSIKEELHNGDIVNIITAKTQKPKADWLNYVVTAKARNKIKACLREEEAKVARFGREELERKLKNWKLSIPIDDAVIALTKYYKYKTGTEFYGAIADGTIDIADTKEVIARYLAGELFEPKAKPAQPAAKPAPEKEQEGDALVIDESIQGLDYKLAKCCNPIFGDDIFGFTTVSSGITIHRSDCPNARRLKQQYPYRVLEARWRSTAGRNSFLASVRIVAEDTTGMVNRITEVVSGELKINIRSMSLSPMRDGKIGGTINIEVPSTAVVDMVAANLMRIKGVEKAYRVTQQ